MEKRSPKTDAVLRSSVYDELSELNLATGRFVGRVEKGLGFLSADGVAFVLSVTVPKVGFDVEFEASDYAETQAKKAEDKAKAEAKKAARKDGAVKVVKPAKEEG